MNALQVSVITPYGKIFDGEADLVSLPGSEGEFGVLLGHSNMLSLLKAGVVEITIGSKKELIAINWGYARVQENQLDILIDDAVLINNSSEQMSASIEKAKKLLQEASNDKIAISSVVSRIDNTIKG